MDERALKYINFHNKPLIKIGSCSTKHFLENSKELVPETEFYQNELRKSLEYIRVEKRGARAKVIWLNIEKLGKIVKLVGPVLEKFGFQNKNGMYLQPFEVLYLLEQNNIELYFENQTVSIEYAFKLLINFSIQNYLVYKTLTLSKASLYNQQTIEKRKQLNDLLTNKNKCKRKFTESSVVYNKKLKITENICEYIYENKKEVKFKSIFEKLKEKSPKLAEIKVKVKDPDFFGFKTTKKEKTEFIFNVYMRDSVCLKDMENNEDGQNLYSIKLYDNVCFYTFNTTNISNLY